MVRWQGIARDNRSDACFQRIFHWQKECDENHSTCSRARDYPLPTRLIDVGIDSFSKPYLLVSKPGDRGRWVTLSHCWGHSMSLKTTTSTLQKHQKGVPVKDFPLSFQDAIFITRRLGFRYLWIDSLCIIQDSHSDWLTESAHMGSYYQNCALTIAADEAPGSAHGIFASAIRQGTGWPTYVPVAYNSPSRKHHGELVFRSPSIDTTGEIPSPLSRRAWTLQETTLSPRVLRYSHEELFWSCNAGSFSESSPDRPLEFDRDHKLILGVSRTGTRLDAMGAMECWYGLMKDYAFRKITFDSDRLVAIAGLAEMVQRHTGFTSPLTG